MDSPFPNPPSASPADEMYAPDDVRTFLQSEADAMGLRVPLEEPDLEDITHFASGGSGEVYLAKDAALGRTIAVKTLNPRYEYMPDKMQRLVREAKAAALLEHPNIIPIHALGISPTRGIYFTMKRLRGDSLRHIIAQLSERNPGYVRDYTIATRLGIFMKICQGISYAHSNGIIHRDLKPENILVGNFGEVTIIDWGLVKKVSRRRPSGRLVHSGPGQGANGALHGLDGMSELPGGNLTMSGEINGTPRFMSPEQVFGHSREIDTRTDIYALGIILYELLTYVNPFGHLSDEDAIMNAVARGLYARPRSTMNGRRIPAVLEAICLKAMSLNKENRYQTVKELIADVIAFLEDRPVSAYTASASEAMLRCFRRNPVKTAVVASSVLACMAYFVIGWLLTSMEADRLMVPAINECNMASTYLRGLEGMIERRLAQDARPTSEQIQWEGARLDEVDNLIVSAYMLLGTLPSKREHTWQIRELRERVLTERILFSLNYGSLNDMKKVRGMAVTQFGYDYGRASERLKANLRRLDDAVEGICRLKMQCALNGVSFTVYPVEEESSTGRRSLGRPLSLASNTLPSPELDIPKGSYMIELNAEGHCSVSQYVSLAHGEHALLRVSLPTSVSEGMVFIPEAKLTLPSVRRHGTSSLLARQPSDALPFFISAHEVTIGEYLEFWTSLKSPEERELYRAQVRLEEKDKRFVLPWNDKGEISRALSNGRRLFTADMPVVGISHAAAEAFCQWKSTRLNRLCRLPSAQEWCRAATGDGDRAFPWGNRFMENASFIRETADSDGETPPLFAAVGTHPDDLSPYGLWDTAGNAREWTGSRFPNDEDYQVMGASRAVSRRFLPLSRASSFSAFPSDIGFRYVMEYSDALDNVPSVE